MKFSKILNIVYVVLLIFLIGIIINGTEITSQNDILLVFLFTSLFCFINSYYFKVNAHIAFIFFFIYIVNFLVPFLYYLYFPDLITDLYFILPKYEYREYGFWKIFAYLDLFFIISYFIFKKSTQLNKGIYRYKNLLSKKLMNFSLLILSLNVLLNYFNLLPVLGIFINPQIYLFFIILFYSISNKKRELNKYLNIFLFIYLISTVVGGSRGGMITVVLYFIIINLYLHKDLTFNKKQLFIALIIVFAGIMSYPIATIFRMINDKNLIFDYSVFFKEDAINPVVYLLANIVSRFSLLDYSFILNNDLYNQQFFIDYFTIRNLVESTLNITFPTSYSDVLVSNNLLANLSFDNSYEEIRNNWSSGNAFLLDFNRLYSYNFFVPLTVFVLYIYSCLIRVFNKNLLLFHIIRIFLIFKIFELFVFFGYDYLTRTFVHSLIPILILYFIFNLSKFLSKENVNRFE